MLLKKTQQSERDLPKDALDEMIETDREFK